MLPGVTAAQAVAARAGAPLGGDYAVVSLSDRLKPWSVIERRLRAVAEADLVLAIYNPASAARREQIVRARELLLGLRASDTPVVVGRHVGRDRERPDCNHARSARSRQHRHELLADHWFQQDSVRPRWDGVDKPVLHALI